jgi:protein SCO1/2
MVVIAIASIAFAVFQPIQVLPRLRLAPGYALVDSDGDRVTSDDGRGVITLYTFVPTECGAECDRVASTMRDVRERVLADVDLGPAGFRLVTIVLDPSPSGAQLAAVGARDGATTSPLDPTLDLGLDTGGAGADGDWLVLGGTSDQLENIVGLGFRRSADPGDFVPSYAIVDGWGMIRGEYRYQTLADDADKLVRHIDVLGGELRNSGGIASFAYEAAHVFQCYP